LSGSGRSNEGARRDERERDAAADREKANGGLGCGRTTTEAGAPRKNINWEQRGAGGRGGHLRSGEQWISEKGNRRLT